MPRTRRARLKRVGRTALIGLVGLSALAWSLRHGPTPVRASGNEPSSAQSSPAGATDLPTLLAAAQAAGERGDAPTADALLRRAIASGTRDTRPASMLRALYDQRDLDLPIDEEAIRAALATLGPGYRVTDTKHFVIVSDCGPAWRARREALLERTYHEVMRFADALDIPVYPPASKLLCVMMHDHAAYQAFGRTNDDVMAHWVAGYYAAGTNRMVLYDDETGPSIVSANAKLDDIEAQAETLRDRARATQGAAANAMRDQAERMERFVRDERARVSASTETRSEAKTIHEATHLIAFNCGLQTRSRRYPMWITEGLATGFETDNPERSFGPDRPSNLRADEFDRFRDANTLEPLETFVGRVKASDDADAAEVEYAESYALFHYVARFHRAELAALLADIGAEPPGEIAPDRHVQLFEQRFGPIGKLERRWIRLEGR